jgi:hypothetical protein
MHSRDSIAQINLIALQGSRAKMKHVPQFIAVFCMFLTSSCLSQTQSLQQIKVPDIESQIERFSSYDQDLVSMGRSLPIEEQQIVSEIDQIAIQTHDHLEAISGMVQMLNGVENREDRSRVSPVLESFLKVYLKFTKSESDRVTQLTTLSRVPAVAQTGLKMRDDMPIGGESNRFTSCRSEA